MATNMPGFQNEHAAPPPAIWPEGPMEFGLRTYVMGIINCTPDSFFDGGKNYSLSAAIAAASAMIEDGADILDVGGESSRPGARRISEEEEILRTIPLIKEIRISFPKARISIDTYKSKVAAAALEAGADMINDISALRLDPDLARVVSISGAPYCLMHMLGTPADMQNNPSYPVGVCEEINRFFEERIDAAAKAGIKETQIILDPGIGFGKTVEHNLEILNNISGFKRHGRPILIGASRKMFIGKTLGLAPQDRLEGSLAAAVLAVARGADIIRAHDVRETARSVRFADAAVRTSVDERQP
ncbi:MAG: dihydropteroate synthase [bacterium]